MLKSFVWMFKAPEYKSHLLYLCKIMLLFIALAGVTYFTANVFKCESVTGNIFFYVTLALCLIPFLVFSGYFWELTSGVIDRTIDLSASNIYDGKIKSHDVVSFPELNIRTFLWRGIASIFATILLFIPHYLMIKMNMYNLESGFINPMFVLPISMFFSFFILSQLWNYARTNSIIEVLNLRKMIYLTGNYFFRYIVTVILYSLVNYLLATVEVVLYNNPQTITNVALLVLYWIVKLFYFSFVYAYLIGSIAPVGED